MLEEFRNLSRMAEEDSLTCMNVVKCIYNLAETDVEVLNALPSEGAITAAEAGKSVGKDRSTAHRSLEKLVACGMCLKEKRAGNPRGYSYYYSRASAKEIYKRTEENLDRCYSRVKAALREME